MQNLTTADKGLNYTRTLVLLVMPFLIFSIQLTQGVVLLLALGMVYFGIKKIKQDKQAGKPIENTRNVTIMATVAATILTACVIAGFFM